MYVDPVSLDSCSCDWIRSAAMNKTPAANLFNEINGLSTPQRTNIFNFTSKVYYRSQDEVIQDYAFVNMYLQYGNAKISKLAHSIVNAGDSDDVKMEKIQAWVVDHIEYWTDEEQYGYPDLWIPPAMLLNTMRGDCEDGAFLIMSLALNAGVDPDKLRFYAGIVKAGQGAETGGHGWVAYKRSIDQEWVPIDFSYYPDLRPMDKRIPLEDDLRYIDDYFMLEVGKVILTPDTNRVRETTYTSIGTIEPNILLTGNWANQYF